MDLSSTALWVAAKVVARAVAATVLTSALEKAFKEEDLVVVVAEVSVATHKANREKAVMVAVEVDLEVLVEASAEVLVLRTSEDLQKALVASQLPALVDLVDLAQALEA